MKLLLGSVTCGLMGGWIFFCTTVVIETIKQRHRVIYVEEGSVDVEELKKAFPSIHVIVYKKGSSIPKTCKII